MKRPQVSIDELFAEIGRLYVENKAWIRAYDELAEAADLQGRVSSNGQTPTVAPVPQPKEA